MEKAVARQQPEGATASAFKRAAAFFKRTGKTRCHMVRGKVVSDTPKLDAWRAKLGKGKRQ